MPGYQLHKSAKDEISSLLTFQLNIHLWAVLSHTNTHTHTYTQAKRGVRKNIEVDLDTQLSVETKEKFKVQIMCPHKIHTYNT